MQAKKIKGKVGRVPQKRVKPNRKGISRKLQQAGRRKLLQGTAAGPVGTAPTFTLKPIDKKLSTLNVKALQGNDEYFSDPVEQVKIISDLYPVISKIPKYKELNKISPNTPPGDVLHSLLKEFNRISSSEDWKIKKNAGSYSLQAIEEYGSCEASWISISFLSQINHTHPKLHELLIYSIMLVASVNGIGLPYAWVQMNNDDRSMGMNFQYMSDMDYDKEEGEEFGPYNEWIEYYGPTGIPVAYLKQMKGNASYKIWKQQLDKFRPSDSVENAAMDYLKKADELISTKTSIHKYCYNEYNEGLTPANYMQFVWSFDDRDQMWHIHCETTDDLFNNSGVHPFRWLADYSKPQDNKTIHNFCELVREFFNVGNDMCNWMNKHLANAPERYPSSLKKKKKNVTLIDTIL